MPVLAPAPTPTLSSTSSGVSNPGPVEVRFQGVLQAIDGTTWTIAGQSVMVNASTEVDDQPQVGDTVEVRADQQPNGSLIATRINKNK